MTKKKIIKNRLILDLEDLIEMDDDKLYKICSQNKEIRFERSSKGELIIMLPVGSEGGAQESTINYYVFHWNKQFKKGKVFSSSSGFSLPNGSMRSPDTAFIRKERWKALPILLRKKFAPICPDFVVELMSENDSLADAQEKMQEWMENGCQLGWLINPKEENTYIYRSNGEIETVSSFDKTLYGEDVLEKFAFHLNELRDEDD